MTRKPGVWRPRYLGLLAVVVLLGVVAWFSWSPRAVERAFVRVLSDDYSEAPTGDMAPSFAAPAAQRRRVALSKVAGGLQQPTDIQFPPAQTRLAVVLEKAGTARWLRLDNGVHGKLFSVDVLTQSEEGLLGLAFHPRFAENGRLFVNVVQADDGKHKSRVLEFHADKPARLDKSSVRRVRVVLEVGQPYQNHNAGQLVFGPDGYLYVGWGDGGLRDDPHANGQNPATWLGSMLRIDIDRPSDGRAYSVPADNPFVGKAGHAPETFALGLRNPWRFSFDPGGRLIVADVGQDAWEEIDIVRAGDNLGWNVREGFSCFQKERSKCERSDLVDPIFVYGRELGVSVTGGYVYTGKAVPELAGLYVFGDFVSGHLFALRLPADRSQRIDEALSLGKWPLLVSSFGRDPSGELYLAAFSRGEIYKLTAAKTAPARSEAETADRQSRP